MSIWSVALLILYMAPTIIAILRRLPAWKGVLVYNLLLGWTVLHWVSALYMATSKFTALFSKPSGPWPITGAEDGHMVAAAPSRPLANPGCRQPSTTS
jgi:hypothetical protein